MLAPLLDRGRQRAGETHASFEPRVLSGKNFASMSAKQDRHLVVGFIGEVLACVGEDVSGDVDGVNPTRMCHGSFGSTK